MAPKTSKHVPRLTAGEFLGARQFSTCSRQFGSFSCDIAYSRTPAASNAY